MIGTGNRVGEMVDREEVVRRAASLLGRDRLK